MGKLWSYSQNPSAFITDPTVRGGVCMAMSYYVMKRTVAGLQTTPALLDRKMGLFTSMQRAHKFDVKLSSTEWVKMLATGDNLRSQLGPYSTAIEEALGGAMTAGKEFMENYGESSIGIYLSLKWNGSGHGITFCFSGEGLSVFDPNLGFYEMKSPDDMQTFEDDFAMYADPGRIGCVVVSGTPRDLQFLAAD